MKRLPIPLFFFLILISFLACGRNPAGKNVPAASTLAVITSAQDFSQKVESSALPVLVDFWATWCPPCRKMNPILERISGKYAQSLVVAKVDVDQNRDLAEAYKIESIPTMMLFHEGKVIGQLVGAMEEAQLESWLQEQLKAAGRYL